MMQSSTAPSVKPMRRGLLANPTTLFFFLAIAGAISSLCFLAMQWYAVTSEQLGFGIVWTIVLATFALIACTRAKSRLVKYFLLFGAFQFSIGYFAAFAATAEMYLPPSTLQAYKGSESVLGAGFLATCTCFFLKRSFGDGAAALPKSANEQRVVRWLLLLSISGIVIAGYVFNTTGIIPLLSDDPLHARYLGSGQEVATSAFVMLQNSTMLFLTSMPLLIYAAIKRRSFLLGFVVLSSMAIVGLGAQRATLVNVAAILAGLIITVKPERMKIAIILVASAALFYLTMEAAMGGFTESPLALYGKALGEVRDFAVLMLQMGHNFMWGKTYVAAFVPLPVTVSTFRAENNISTFMVRTLALPESIIYGGIRMTIYGEGYVNFGILGSIGVGAFYGWLVAKLDVRLAALQEHCKGDIFRAYPVVLPATILLTGIFLSSTNAIWNLLLKPTILVWLIYWFVSRRAKPTTAQIVEQR